MPGCPLQVMFLAEAALGREHHIIRDNPSLRRPPSGQHTANGPFSIALPTGNIAVSMHSPLLRQEGP